MERAVLYFGGKRPPPREVSVDDWRGGARTPGVSWLLIDDRGYGLSEGSLARRHWSPTARGFDRFAADANRS